MEAIETVLAIDDVHEELVEIPEWNGATIRVVSMSAAERCEVEAKWSDRKASSNPSAFRVDILFRSIKNPDGSPWGTAEQFGALMQKNAVAVERLFEACCRVSALTKADVESLQKN